MRVHSDACAAIGIARRRGLGQTRHLDVEDLWVQTKVRYGSVLLETNTGSENPANMLTTHVSADLLTKTLGKMNMRFLDGRSPAAQEPPPEKQQHPLSWMPSTCHCVQFGLSLSAMETTILMDLKSLRSAEPGVSNSKG